LKIDVEMADGSRKSYRIISGMAKTGFLLSPLIANTDDFAAFYDGGHRLESKKVSAFSIDAKRRWYWDKEYEIQFIELDQPARPQAATPSASGVPNSQR
jgi:hypothetical protein